MNSDSLAPDTWLVCWARRAVTLPLYALLTAAAWMALPLLVPIALIVDALYGRRWSTTRALLFFPFYLACECLGVAASLLLWVEYRLRPSVDRSKFLDRNFWLQQLWAAALFEGARRLFGFRVELENFEEATRELAARPLVVFFRHASTVDTVLPAAYLSRAQGTRLRYVMKRELLWDPCLDIVGQRLPNIFLRRDSPDPQREVARRAPARPRSGPRRGRADLPRGHPFYAGQARAHPRPHGAVRPERCVAAREGAAARAASQAGRNAGPARAVQGRGRALLRATRVSRTWRASGRSRGAP